MFLTLDDHVGFEAGNRFRHWSVDQERFIDPDIGLDALQPKQLRHMCCIAGNTVAFDRDNEALTTFLGKAQQAYVARMQDVEMARYKDGFRFHDNKFIR